MTERQSSPPGLRNLSGYRIKLIALAIMTIDHIAAYGAFPMSAETYTIMRMIGRLAAPLFLFMNVEGLRHSRSRGRLILRLYLAGITMNIATAILAARMPGREVDIGNIFPTFFYLALTVCCVDTLRSRPEPGRALTASAGLILPLGLAALSIWLGQTGRYELWERIGIILPSPMQVEYSPLFILLGVAWYYVNDRRINALIFLGASLISGLVPVSFFFSDAVQRIPILNSTYFTGYHLFTDVQWCMVFALPLMLRYDGTRGKGSKWLFYIYYPLHQYALFFASLLWN